MNEWTSALASISAGLATGSVVGLGIVRFALRRIFVVIDSMPPETWFLGVDGRLERLEHRVNLLDKDVVKTNVGLESLSSVLEHYFAEIQNDLKEYRKADDKAHDRIENRLTELTKMVSVQRGRE